MRDRPDQGVAESLGLCAHAGIGDGAREAELLDRRGGIVQDGFDAGAHLAFGFRRAPAEIDGDHAEVRRLGRDRAYEPEIAEIVFDCRSIGALRLAGEHGERGGPHLRGCVVPADPVRRTVHRPPRLEQDDFTFDQSRQMLLDGVEDVGRGMHGSEPTRKRIEVADFLLALLDRLRLASHAHREI